ncbi:hypothetical protein PFISCL1PPCAC_9963 [Pristionchus fissidentatus]|uniref:receptor protein-tyrosine kinase n=1 Tax=Pristionchus fissidentatus TaxID=1538716 RepID=A0AAV5VJ55_9BILA|nr:hypothetical protein PFISCL1PPCAC_9963 [Pristionchus fissidentatus]
MREDPNRRGSSSSRSNTSISSFFVFLLLAQTTEAQHSICGSVDIRNDARTVFNKENASDEFITRYMNCTILEGTFSLSMITNSSTREEDFVTFPNLVEITGYLLVFNVKSLTTLSRIFPNLRIIGGSQLIMNYALIIYQNPDLKDIGLPNLRVIRNGGVRISENPSLCFAVQIDWKRITFGQIDDVLVTDGVASGQKCTDQCDDPSNRCVRRQTAGGHGGLVISCWNATTCQETCEYDMTRNATKEAGPGCLVGTSGDTSVACHPQCLGGCYEVDNSAECIACKGFLNDGRCVSQCPRGMYKYLSRCVTEQECVEEITHKRRLMVDGSVVLSSPELRIDDEWHSFKVVNGSCLHDCPAGYETKKVERRTTQKDGKVLMRMVEACEKCGEYCPKKCKGRALDTIAMAKDLTGCNIVDGDLDIQLRDRSKISLLTDALKDIEVITGQLLIRFSPSLTSLSVFQNLKEIRGERLFQEKYSLVIYENTNLQSLFSNETLRNLKITRGEVQVQNNRMLCFKYIDKMMQGLNKNLTDLDQSLYSNGDKAICDETTLVLETNKVMSEGFVLKWTPLSERDIDHRKFLGYQVFYKRVESDDPSAVQIDQDRSVCSDEWTMHFEPLQNKEKNKVQSEKKEENATLTGEEEKRKLYEGGDVDPDKYETGKKKPQNGWSDDNYMNSVITHDGIMPNAYYATYVQTKMVIHPGAKNARSNIHIVKTHFNNPTSPKIVSVNAIGTDQLEVEFEEPSRPNGDITHYILSWHAQYKDVSFEVTHACDSVAEKRRRYQESATTTMTTPAQQSFVTSITGSFSTADTCSANGCCVCTTGQEQLSSSAPSTPRPVYDDADYDQLVDPDRQHDFENAVQNIVFVPSSEEGDRRSKRSISVPKEGEKEGGETEKLIEETKSEREKEEDEEEKKTKHENDNGEFDTDEVEMPEQRGYLMLRGDGVTEVQTINITTSAKTNKYTITGLYHATTYQVSLIACQNVSVFPHFCSLKPVYKSQRTAEIKEFDKVNQSTIETVVLNRTSSGAVFVKFKAPEKPNGRVHGFTVTLYNVVDEQATPISHCVNSSIFAGGVIIRGLADGTYVPSIITITAEGGSIPVRGPPFVIHNSSFFNLYIIAGLVLLVLVILALIGASTAYYAMTKGIWGKKLGVYVRQTITANPEYLSQFEMYKADEWELKREDITIGEEIGRGTFGKVYRGHGNGITSLCGTIFGECAIKTVSEDANPAERLHFLMEASVMKQFNSPFIIHLYGVVSDGQPVLVVMEMMAKGNLRDYLRSRRPDAEENILGLPVPTDTEIMEWAAQIADGMSYLEYLKFCHRDLAARNCMIGEDNCVKIGDFGMARDIYYHEYYKPTGKRMMPVRWMAPESLKDGKFSLKSDVWAYGIVLYEMMTLAQQPYQGLANDSVFNYIGVTRRVLERPVDCPDFWYDLMCACWQYQPKERPTFRQIVECLFLRASEDFRNRSWVINEAPDLDERDKGDERNEFIIDEDVQGMFCMDNRRGNEMDEYGDRDEELINGDAEDSV